MPRCYLVVTASLLVLLFYPGTGYAEQLESITQRFEAIEARVGAVQSDLKATGQSSAALSSDRLELQEAKVQLTELRKSIQSSIRLARMDIETLGVPPENAREPQNLRDLRRTLDTRLSNLQGLALQATALDEQIDQLLSAAGRQLRDRFVDSVFARAPLPYLPETIDSAANAAQKRLAEVTEFIASWIKAQRDSGTLTVSAATIVGSLLIFWVLTVPARSFIADQVWRRFWASRTDARRALRYRVVSRINQNYSRGNRYIPCLSDLRRGYTDRVGRWCCRQKRCSGHFHLVCCSCHLASHIRARSLRVADGEYG